MLAEHAAPGLSETRHDSSESPVDAWMTDSPKLHALQRRHFVLFAAAPLILTLGTLVSLFFHTPTRSALVVGALMWLLTGAAVSIGFHRMFAHKAFETGPLTRSLIAILGSMAAQGSVIAWVAIHRRHHQRSDQAGDLHSPNLRGNGWKAKLKGLYHAHLAWMVGYPFPNMVHYAPDLVSDPWLLYVNRHYRKWVYLGMALPALGCALYERSWIGFVDGFIWGAMVRMCIVAHGMWSLNSICHLIGRQQFKTRDQSRNVALLAPFVFGETWHNNHHAFPRSAWMGLAWYRVDPGFWIIRLLGLLRLASNIHVPSPEQIDRKTLR